MLKKTKENLYIIEVTHGAVETNFYPASVDILCRSKVSSEIVCAIRPPSQEGEANSLKF